MGGSSSKYARGSRAWGLCQKCGLRFLLRTLLFDGYFPGLRVCAGCYDSKQPQEFLVDVTDPTTLYRPSPEFGPKPSVLVAMQVSNAIVLNWSETDPRGNARVKEYQVWQASSPYPDMFPSETLIATLPVEYYGDPGAPSLADLVENGSGRLGNTYDNEGIVEETLSYQDDSATSLNRYYKYSILALLQANPSDEYTMARSNEVIVQLLRPPSIESIIVGGDFIDGSFADAIIIPPFTGGTALEKLSIGGDFVSGSFEVIAPAPTPETIMVGPTKLMPVAAGMDGTRQHIPGLITTINADMLMFGVSIYGFVGSADPVVASISCGGLTFTLKETSVGLSNPGGTESVRLEIWTAPIVTQLTNEPFDITLTGESDDACAMGVGFIGAVGFDTGGGTMPATDQSLATGPIRTTGTTTVDTSNVSDLLLAIMVQNEVAAPITFNPDYVPIFDCHIFVGARPIGMALAGYTPGANLAGYVTTGNLTGGATLFGLISMALHG